MDSDERFMWVALDLARQGRGKTNPNPMVGAVIVKEGEIAGTGFHRKAGDRHAEIIALEEAGEKARGATMYVNLEPCSHYGRTPPCVDAIINAGIRKVVVAVVDPNPLVAGRGVRKLKEAGIKVKVGVLEDKARRLNEVFFKYITTKTPFVIVKSAMTFDGKIATGGGKSRWITGEKSREFVHRLRSRADAIMVGINTVLKDDPLLTVRLPGGEKGRNPVRIIVDSRGKLPLNARVVTTIPEARTILATTEYAPADRLADLSAAGVEILELPLKNNRVDLNVLMSELGKMEISMLMVEGGGNLNYSLLEENLIDKVYFFIAPLLFGGKNALTPFEGDGIPRVEDSWIINDVEMKQFENDLLLIGYPARREEIVYRDSGGIGGNIKSAAL
ncbi:MAG: bifunctional diaminohydroxyphosphoribosylaminopyrimidine deaminase/5-amino-6-(5-phosphoribosylamino)uracil reductase RibD [Dethiobacteria bacterium]|jgi:diaminohydroxyphosphoribosylaminopyrimidine deaminase/5-amino-6-(5-phosphoribosylamino)uracil reductase